MNDLHHFINGTSVLNRRDEPLTRFGIYSLVRRAADQASRTLPSIAAKRISPHCLRHSCAVHLLRSGVDINTIRAWLGHVSLDTTHIYAEVDLEMKAKALALCDLPNDVATKPWHSDPGRIGLLRSRGGSICKSYVAPRRRHRSFPLPSCCHRNIIFTNT